MRINAVTLRCRALDKAINSDDKPSTKDLHALRAEQLKLLGWSHLHRSELSRMKTQCPPAYPLF